MHCKSVCEENQEFLTLPASATHLFPMKQNADSPYSAQALLCKIMIAWFEKNLGRPYMETKNIQNY